MSSSHVHVLGARVSLSADVYSVVRQMIDANDGAMGDVLRDMLLSYYKLPHNVTLKAQRRYLNEKINSDMERLGMKRHAVIRRAIMMRVAA